jgi:hypothetical protein
VGEDFAAEAPFLLPLPAERFDTVAMLWPRVDRYGRISVGEARYSVPARLIDARVRVRLAKSAWVAAGQPCCLIGDSGTGKSHLLIVLGTPAAESGYRVKYTTAAALVNELVEAADDKTLSRTIARYGRVDLLCLDELGYLELDRRGAELLFQVFTEREERASIAIASNAAFSEWTATFTDPRLCAGSWTGSPSTRTSSRPVPTPTGCAPPRPATSPAAPDHRAPKEVPWPSSPSPAATTRSPAPASTPGSFSRRDVATTLISAAFAGSGLLRSPCPDPAGEGEQAVLC